MNNNSTLTRDYLITVNYTDEHGLKIVAASRQPDEDDLTLTLSNIELR